MANVSLEDVRGAVADLEAAGRRPSVAAIGVHLGRGSSSTITKHWRTIREEREAAVAGSATAPDHSPADEILEQLSKVSRDAALALYQVLAAPLREEASRMREQLAREREEMNDEIDQVMLQANEATERAVLADRELLDSRSLQAGLQERLTAAMAELEAQRERHASELARADQHRQELAEAHARQIQLLTVQLAEGRERELAAAQRLETLVAEAGELRGQVAAQKAELERQRR